jgi:sulfur-oxidizing protein SoxB
VENSGGKTLVTNAGSNGKFLGVMDLDVGDGKVRGYRYRLLPVFANLLPADAAMQAYIDEVRRPYLAQLNGAPGRHRDHPLSVGAISTAPSTR